MKEKKVAAKIAVEKKTKEVIIGKEASPVVKGLIGHFLAEKKEVELDTSSKTLGTLQVFFVNPFLNYPVQGEVKELFEKKRYSFVKDILRQKGYNYIAKSCLPEDLNTLEKLKETFRIYLTTPSEFDKQKARELKKDFPTTYFMRSQGVYNEKQWIKSKSDVYKAADKLAEEMWNDSKPAYFAEIDRKTVELTVEYRKKANAYKSSRQAVCLKKDIEETLKAMKVYGKIRLVKFNNEILEEYAE